MRGGSSIKARSRGSGAEGSTSFPGYSDAAALNRDYQAIDVLDELTFGRTIGSARYNTLVITERHDMVNALTDQDTVKYLRHYHDQFIRANASGQTYFYSPWLSHKDDKAREWIAYERAIYLGWDCVSVRINHSLSTVGRADRIKMIPASLALADLVERALDGNVTGISGGTTVQVLQRLFSDDVHLTELGSYYVAMVTLAAVYNRSPAGAAHPSGVTGQQAASLQTAAWNFVSNHMQSAPVRTLSQCQSSVPELCATFWNFDWIYANRPDLVPSCEARLRTQNTSNPFFYSSATDVAYWLPNPQ